MIKRILAEAAIVAVQTAVLLGLAATVGVERGEHPIAAEEALIKQDQGGRHLHDRRCVLRDSVESVEAESPSIRGNWFAELRDLEQD